MIPKSVNPDRIRSNADVGGFSLTDDDMAPSTPSAAPPVEETGRASAEET